MNVNAHNTHSSQNSPQPETSALFLCTKSLHALSAAKALDEALPKSIPLVLFQNGMGSQFEILDAIKERPIFAAITTSGANIDNQNTLQIAGIGETIIGPLNTLGKSATQQLADDLSKYPIGKHSVHFSTTIRNQMWKKLIINCGINAITAIENCRNGDIANTATFHEIWPQLMCELFTLANATNLDMTKEDIQHLILSVARETGNNISSMLQDVRANKPTEIEHINGFALKTLQKMGLDAQANQTLIERVYALRH